MEHGRDRDPKFCGSSQPRHRSGSRQLSTLRHVKASDMRCEYCPDAFLEGDAVRVYSRSSETWLDGKVVKRMGRNQIRVEYNIQDEVDRYRFGKMLDLHSDQVVAPIFCAASNCESCVECHGDQPSHNPNDKSLSKKDLKFAWEQRDVVRFQPSTKSETSTDEPVVSEVHDDHIHQGSYPHRDVQTSTKSETSINEHVVSEGLADHIHCGSYPHKDAQVSKESQASMNEPVVSEVQYRHIHQRSCPHRDFQTSTKSETSMCEPVVSEVHYDHIHQGPYPQRDFQTSTKSETSIEEPDVSEVHYDHIHQRSYRQRDFQTSTKSETSIEEPDVSEVHYDHIHQRSYPQRDFQTSTKSETSTDEPVVSEVHDDHIHQGSYPHRDVQTSTKSETSINEHVVSEVLSDHSHRESHPHKDVQLSKKSRASMDEPVVSEVHYGHIHQRSYPQRDFQTSTKSETSMDEPVVTEVHDDHIHQGSHPQRDVQASTKIETSMDEHVVSEVLAALIHRKKSYPHREFVNPESETCWLSSIFQSLWHSSVFHAAFDLYLAPSKCIPNADEKVLMALQQTWSAYSEEKRDSDGSPHLVPKDLVKGFGSGWGDSSDALGSILNELSRSSNPAARSISRLITFIPVGFEETLPDPAMAWKRAIEDKATEFPLLAVDLSVQQLSRDRNRQFACLWIPRRQEALAIGNDLSPRHRLVALVCFMYKPPHYVTFCRRQSDCDQCHFFNDIPRLTPGASKEVAWQEVPNMCFQYNLAPRLALYESIGAAEEVVRQLPQKRDRDSCTLQ